MKRSSPANAGVQEPQAGDEGGWKRPATSTSWRTGKNGTIYIGVTSDLIKRVYEHREGLIGGFTKRHECKQLVWFEAYDDLQEARNRELQMKEWKRAWKIKRIEEKNFDWDDLYPTLF